MVNIEQISKTYTVRKLELEDVIEAYNLFLGNPEYFKHCPPEPSVEMVKADMRALPPGKLIFDKYYTGYFDENNKLVGVIDLIERYPDKKSCFIGFFMLLNSLQNKGLGTKLMNELFEYLKSLGYEEVRLGYVTTNNHAKHFWQKQGFNELIKIAKQDLYDMALVKKTL